MEKKKEVSFEDIDKLTEEVYNFVIQKGFDVFDKFDFLTRVGKVIGSEIDRHSCDEDFDD